MHAGDARPSLGLRANIGQFALLVGVNGLVGGVLGQERAVLPLLAQEVFGLSGFTTILAFVGAFGLSKAATNLVAGRLADRFGRKPVLMAGWMVGVPVPILLILAPSWDWILLANLLLGVHQGLAWSATVIMKIDLVGPGRRGLALGLNEAAGYGAVAITAIVTGYVAAEAGLRPAPFLIGLAYVGLGLGVSGLFVRETRGHARLESTAHPAVRRSWPWILVTTTLRERSLSAASQAGLVNNLNDGVAWGLLPLLFASRGLSLVEIGLLAAAYPAVWGTVQIGTGALSDRVGRKPLIVVGMMVQAIALAFIGLGSDFTTWLLAAVLLGIGTAMVYPTLLAAIADVADASWRGAAVGVYRFWRDLGFAAGALGAGLVADAFGIPAAIEAVAALTAISGAVVLVRMRETLDRAPGRHPTVGVAGEG